jgi:hypothetical protein
VCASDEDASMLDAPSLMGVALVFWANGGGILSKLFGD